MAWSAPIWIYLWMAGMAGGAYFAAFLAERFTGADNRKDTTVPNGNPNCGNAATVGGVELELAGQKSPISDPSILLRTGCLVDQPITLCA